MLFILKNDNTFIIINASPTDQPGTHWMLFAQTGGHIFFSVTLGKKLYGYPLVYKHMRRTIHEGNELLMKKPIQSADSMLCGLYCIYVAHVIFTKKCPIGFKFNDPDLIKVS